MIKKLFVIALVIYLFTEYKDDLKTEKSGPYPPHRHDHRFVRDVENIKTRLAGDKKNPITPLGEEKHYANAIGNPIQYWPATHGHRRDIR